MDPDTNAMGDQVRFQTTRWNLVQSAGNIDALDALIRIYWKPLYFYIRQHGYDNETSKDMVQAFLSMLLERGGFSRADPQRGKFRTFLLFALSNFMKDWKKAAHTLKRGSGNPTFPLDLERGESEYALMAARGLSPDVVLNRAWAKSLWQQSLSELEGQPEHLEAFRLYLDDRGLAEIAQKTGLSESAAQSAVHRLKGRIREIVVGHIRETVSTEADLQAEVAEFTALLGSHSLGG